MSQLHKNQLHQLMEHFIVIQDLSELYWLYRKLIKIDLNIILEIGLEWGGTLKIWEILLRNVKNPLLIGIDVENKIKWNVRSSVVPIHIVTGDSQQTTTLQKVRDILNGRKVDFLFIDGCHEYEAVKSDYTMYGNLVRSGGLIVFHDTKTEKDKVGRFFQELKGKKERYEIVQGTGLIYKE